MLKIVSAEEPLSVETIVALIYGQPGVFKTSTGFTTNNPLLLDFDNGVHRSAYRKDAVRISCWADIASMTAEDLAGYDTIVIDTVGRCLDVLTEDIGRTDPKKMTNGSLNMQGWGVLKNRFIEWMKRLRTMGKDVVMIAHEREDKRGEEVVMRHDVQGGAKEEVFKIADAIGYMYRGHDGVYLDFDSTPQKIGKNIAGIPAQKVPDFASTPNFFGDIITDIKDGINALTEDQKATVQIIEAEINKIAELKSLKSVNDYKDNLNTLPPQRHVQSQVKNALVDKAKQLGFVLNEDKSAFIKPEEKAAE